MGGSRDRNDDVSIFYFLSRPISGDWTVWLTTFLVHCFYYSSAGKGMSAFIYDLWGYVVHFEPSQHERRVLLRGYLKCLNCKAGCIQFLRCTIYVVILFPLLPPSPIHPVVMFIILYGMLGLA